MGTPVSPTARRARASTRLRRAALLPVVLLLASCVQFSWNSGRIGIPLPDEQLDWALQVEPDLGTALGQLGAPQIVRPFEDRGFEVVWVWRRLHSYGWGVSVPVSDAASASLQWDSGGDDADGLRIIFDNDGNYLEGSRGAVLAIR